MTVSSAIQILVPGILLLSLSHLVLQIQMEESSLFYLYSGTTITGYLLIMAGGTRLSRIVSRKLKGDIFNKQNQTFPQEERTFLVMYQSPKPYKDFILKNKTEASCRSTSSVIGVYRCIGTIIVLWK